MPGANPPTRQFRRNIAIATVAAAGFGYYVYTRSRARRARLIQPEERQQYHAEGQPQTTEGGGKAARAKEIPRSAGVKTAEVMNYETMYGFAYRQRDFWM